MGYLYLLVLEDKYVLSYILLCINVMRLWIDDIISVVQRNTRNRLWWYVHVLREEDNDWVKKCTEYEAEGPRPRGRPERTWREVVKDDCQARKLNKEDAMDRSKWRKMINDVRWSGWVWVGECFFWYLAHLDSHRQRAICVCVCNACFMNGIVH